MAEGTVNLNGDVHHRAEHLRNEVHGYRLLLGDVETVLHAARDVQDHQTRDVQITPAVGEHPLHSLTLTGPLAERFMIASTGNLATKPQG